MTTYQQAYAKTIDELIQPTKEREQTLPDLLGLIEVLDSDAKADPENWIATYGERVDEDEFPFNLTDNEVFIRLDPALVERIVADPEHGRHGLRILALSVDEGGDLNLHIGSVDDMDAAY